MKNIKTKSSYNKKIAAFLVVCMILQGNVVNFGNNTNNKNNMDNVNPYYFNVEETNETDANDINGEDENIYDEIAEPTEEEKIIEIDYEEEPEEDNEPNELSYNAGANVDGARGEDDDTEEDNKIDSEISAEDKIETNENEKSETSTDKPSTLQDEYSNDNYIGENISSNNVDGNSLENNDEESNKSNNNVEEDNENNTVGVNDYIARDGEENTEEKKSTKSEANIEIEDENISTASEIELEDIFISSPSDTEKIEQDENISTISEIDKIEIIASLSEVVINNEIATLSEIATTSEVTTIQIATESEVMISTQSEIIIATVNEALLLGMNGDINITKDTIYDKTLYITKDTVINIASYSLILATNSVGILVKNAKLEINGIEGSEILGSDYNVCIQAENATIDLKNVTLKAGLDANCIEVVDTNININGANIYGGDGLNYNNKKGGEGKSGIVAKQNERCEIIFNGGFLKGGKGGKGYSINENASAGHGLIYNNVYMINNDEKGPFDGYAGHTGGGKGGDAIIINSNYEDLLIINGAMVEGGDGGEQNKDVINKYRKNLLGVSMPDEPEESYYSLRDLGLTTSVKHQGDTSTCWAFSYVSAAETGIMKNDPEYAQTLIKEGESEIDLSEMYMIYYYFNHPEDPLGNAGESSVVYTEKINIDTRYSYITSGADLKPISIFTSQARTPGKDEYYLNSSKVEDKDTLFYSKYNLDDTLKSIAADDPHVYDIPVKPTEIVIISRSKFAAGREGDIAFHKALRKYIKEYGSVQMGMSSDNVSKKYKINDKKDSAYWSAERKYTNGHAIHIVGWDDNFPKENFESSAGKVPESDGALLVKDSYGSTDEKSGYFWLSYEHTSHSIYNAVAYRFEKKLENENTYFCDGSLADQALDLDKNLGSTAKGYGNKYIIKKECEKLQAVSIYQTVNTENYNGNLSIYKLEEENIKSNRTLLYKQPVSITQGNNYIKLDKEIYVAKDDILFICVEDIDRVFYLPFSKAKDGDIIYNSEYKSGISYMLPKSSTTWGAVNTVQYNFRVRLITNTSDNVYQVNFNKADKPENATHEAYGNNRTTEFMNFGKPVILTNDSLALEGWNVGGWSLNRDGSTKDYDNNKEYTAVDLKASTSVSVVNLYSYWEPNQYNINFEADNEYIKDKIDKVVAKYDNDVELAKIDESKLIGADFKGWIYNDHLYQSGEKITSPNFTTVANDNINMVATFSNYRFNIQFVKMLPDKIKKQVDGNIPNINDLEYRVSTVSIPNSVYTCSGLTFKGWSVVPNGEVVLGANQEISSYDLLSKYNLNRNNFSNGATFNLYSKFEKQSGGGGSPGGGGKGGGGIAPINDQEHISNTRVSLFNGPAVSGYIPVITNGHMEMNIDGSISYITDEGEKLIGWNKIDVNNETNYYFFTEEGKMWIGWLKDNSGKIYMLGLDGKMMTGNYQTVEGIYKFDTSGKFLGKEEDILKTGLPVLETYRGEWSTISADFTTAVYVLKNGDNEIKNVFKNGLYKIEDNGIEKIYYFDELGVAKVGLQMIGNKLYYFEMGGENLGVLTYEVKIVNGKMELIEAKDIVINTTPYTLTGIADMTQLENNEDEKNKTNTDKKEEKKDEEEPEEDEKA